ncbi:hypothetical protein Vi05172_g10870 [Venturia inaequalis]|nr:hypothetical protein Vi05172_g10870 [Venturia inaequalis]
MHLTTALSFASLLTAASTLPLQPRDGQAYKDVVIVLERITATVTTIGNHVAAWPGNPKRPNTFAQILNHIPILKQDCANLLSDLQVGTDWVQQTSKKDTLGVVDSVSIVPKLASLNSAVSAYKDAIVDKRAWADTSSSTPDLYEQLRLQKQWASRLSTAITQSLGVTTSWLGGPVGDFFFGAKLDEAIQAYAEGGKYRPAGSGAAQEGGLVAPYYPAGTVPSVGPQNWPGAQGGVQGQGMPYPPQGQPSFQQQQGNIYVSDN